MMNSSSAWFCAIAGGLGHGVGARSIAAYCEKYGAVCDYRAENGWFTVQSL